MGRKGRVLSLPFHDEDEYCEECYYGLFVSDVCVEPVCDEYDYGELCECGCEFGDVEYAPLGEVSCFGW